MKHGRNPPHVARAALRKPYEPHELNERVFLNCEPRTTHWFSLHELNEHYEPHELNEPHEPTLRHSYEAAVRQTTQTVVRFDPDPKKGYSELE